MSIEPKRIGAGEFGARVAGRPGRGDWLALLVPELQVAEAAEALASEIAAMGEAPVQRVESPESAPDFAHRLALAAPGVIVASGLERLSDDEWKHLDLLRSQLQRDQPVALVLSMAAIERLMQNAPNLTSWLGGSVWQWDSGAESLSVEEREARLTALRAWSGKGDAEVIDLARRRALPPDPWYAEWLVLLGHGDLLER